MPITLQKIMRVGKFRVHVRKRKTADNKFTYELRYRKDGYNIEACGKTKESAKANFLEKARTATPKKKKEKKDSLSCFPTTFTAFSMYYFERFRTRKVTPQTYEKDLVRFNKYLAPFFGEMNFEDITPTHCQNLLDSDTLQDKSRTCEDLYGLMSVIFKAAAAHGLMTKNPLDLVIKVKHVRTHGKALTNDEISKMIRDLSGSTIEFSCMLMLCTGARPNELETARIDGKKTHPAEKQQKQNAGNRLQEDPDHRSAAPLSSGGRRYPENTFAEQFGTELCENRAESQTLRSAHDVQHEMRRSGRGKHGAHEIYGTFARHVARYLHGSFGRIPFAGRREAE